METCGGTYAQNAIYHQSVAILAVCLTYISITNSGAFYITTARSGR